jgi:hypothetical protein
MNDFEKQLERALARREPSSDFVLRVMRAAAAEQQSNRGRNSLLERAGAKWFRDRWEAALRFAPVFAALVLAAGGAFYQHHEHLMQGEVAKHQLLVAMRIAGEKLHSAQQQVVSIGAEQAIN